MRPGGSLDSTSLLRLVGVMENQQANAMFLRELLELDRLLILCAIHVLVPATYVQHCPERVKDNENIFVFGKMLI
jgi:hypothetical protein